jgi:hypothetical protein
MRVKSFGALAAVLAISAFVSLPSAALANTPAELRDPFGEYPTTIKLRSLDLRAETPSGAIVCPHSEFTATRRGAGRFTGTSAKIEGGSDCPVIPTAGRLTALIKPVEFRGDIKFRKDVNGAVRVEARLDLEIKARDVKLGGLIRECKYEVTLGGKMVGDSITVENTAPQLIPGGDRLSSGCSATATMTGEIRVSDREGNPIEAH